MTKTTYRTFLAAVALVALTLMISPTPIQAQGTLALVKVPFDFHIGDKTMPAGQYTVSKGRNDASVVQISDRDGHSSVILAIPVTRRFETDPKLIFNRYGDEYFLTEVRWMESSSAAQIPPSALERELAKNGSPQQVAATGRRR